MKSALSIVVLAGLVIGASVWLSRDDFMTGAFARYTIDALDEASGLGPSQLNDGVYWTHNDSGDTPRLFATTVDGRLVGEFSVDGAQALDWETITTDGAGSLYVGDIGNNKNTRQDLTFYRVGEPRLPADGIPYRSTLKVEHVYRFHYPEQRAFPDPTQLNFDSEASFWATHPTTGQGTLYLLTKHRSDQRTLLYRFDELVNGKRVALKRVGQYDLGGDPKNFGGMATGAAITRDGRFLAVLSYHAIFIFERPDVGDDYLSELRNRIDLNQGQTQQVEAIAWAGAHLVFTNEQGMIFRVQQPLQKREARFPAQQGSP